MNPTTFTRTIALSAMMLFMALNATSQDATGNWKASLTNAKAFIENKGQFKNDVVEGDILYVYDDQSTVIYFTKKGSTYAFLKRLPKVKDKEELEREARQTYVTAEEWKKHEIEEGKINYQSDYAGFTWENSNPHVQVTVSDVIPEYYSYGYKDKDNQVINQNFVRAYEKLTYVNLYPNIDVEYTFHPQGGIKYAIILHPGADVSKIKMKYTEAPVLNRNGDLHIKTIFGNIVEHAPVTFYQDNARDFVKTQFAVNGNVVTFQVANYDHNRALVIDPWVQTPTIASSNGVWECERDAAGNVYIIGGDTPLKLLKYSVGGVLQWTYTTPFDTSADGDWLGTFATDLAGNSYVTNGSDAQLEKINTSGGLTYHVNGGGFDEYWNIAFNCDQSKLIIGGTRLTLPIENSNGVIFDINTSNGSVNNLQNVGTICTFSVFGMPQTVPNEVRSITSSYNARYYYMTLDSIGAIDQNVGACPTSNSILKLPHTYSFGYKCEDYRPDNGNAGIMSIRANRNFVYTQNGTTIHKRSLATGGILTTAAIAGGANSTIPLTTPTAYMVSNSGLDIDSCGNVYAGSSDRVVKYDANLNPLTSYNTSYHVYDVTVTNSGSLIICGATGDNSSSSRTGYVELISMSTCKPQALYCCNANICPTGPLCSTDPAFNLTPSTPGGTWSGTGITNASLGTFNPATAGPGTHWVHYTLACGSDSVQIVVNLCANLNICQETNGTITVTGGTAPYTWSNLNLVQNCSACLIPAFCQPPAANCPTWDTTWVTFTTGSNITPSGTWPIHVVDGSSNSSTILSLASLPACAACPTLTVNTFNVTAVSCFGLTNGSFNVSTTGGASPYDYVVLLGGTTIGVLNNVSGTQLFSGLAPGTYTINVTDNNGCPGTTTVIITQPPVLTVTISGTLTFCNGASTTLDAGAGYSSYLWSNTLNTQTINVTTGGVYSVTVTNSSGCSATNSVTTVATASANASITSTGPVCILDGAITLTAVDPGGTWSGTGITNGTTGAFDPTVAGVGSHQIIYTITGACGDADTVNIVVTSTFDATIDAAGPFCTGDIPVDLTAVDPGGSWSGVGITSSINGTFSPLIAGAGSHIITYTLSGNCGDVDTATIIVRQTQTITASIVDESCAGASDGSIFLQITGGAQPYDIIWNNSATSQEIDSLAAGNYIVIVTDSLGCSNTQNYNVLASGIDCYEPVIYVPNIFSPNGDGINDILYVHGRGIKSMSFIVYDRWGEKVFSTTDNTKGWDGTFRGKPMDSAVYMYYLKATLNNDEEIKTKGSITIVR